MICHVWIDRSTGATGWQGDLFYAADGTYTDNTVTPPAAGASDDLAYLRMSRRTWEYLNRLPGVGRQNWLATGGWRSSDGPTQTCGYYLRPSGDTCGAPLAGRLYRHEEDRVLAVCGQHRDELISDSHNGWRALPFSVPPVRV